MTVTNWNVTTIDGQQFLVIDVAKIRVPLDWDPSSNVFIAIAAPTGGVLNYPVLAQGDPGVTPDIDTAINYTPLAKDDPTPASASWTETSPNVYKLNLALHEGADGANGNTVLDPGDFTGAAPGKMIALNSGATAFVLQTPKVGGRHYPASINSTPSGNAAYTLAVVNVGPYDFPVTVEPHGGAIVVGTSSDVRVDLYARLDGETAGNIVGRALGQTGINPAPHNLHPRLPAGASNTYDVIAAGATKAVYLRAERVTGTGTFTTSSTDTDFWVKANPVP
jgi:hypothetical protein